MRSLPLSSANMRRTWAGTVFQYDASLEGYGVVSADADTALIGTQMRHDMVARPERTHETSVHTCEWLCGRDGSAMRVLWSDSEDHRCEARRATRSRTTIRRRAQRLTESHPSSGLINLRVGRYGSLPKLRRRSLVVSLDPR